MENSEEKISSFTQLDVWKQGHQFVLYIYKITRLFPKEEQYGLTNQIRRAAVSITSNIAEGFSRHSYKEKIQFYCIALGSVTEVQNQLLISHDIGFVQKTDFDSLSSAAGDIHKMLNGLIKKSKTFIHTS